MWSYFIMWHIRVIIVDAFPLLKILSGFSDGISWFQKVIEIQQSIVD